MSAGLSYLGEDRAFDESGDYASVIAEKARIFSQNASRHFRVHDFPGPLASRVMSVMAGRLADEWPGMFRLDGETLVGPGGEVQLRPMGGGRDAAAGGEAGATGAFDQLCRQVMEDVVVIRRVGDRDFNSAIHLAFPNGWSPEEKIGKSFFETHVPVTGMETLNTRAAQWVSLMIGAPAGLVRYVWGLRWDDALDHHPDSPAAPWNPERPRAFLRYERQTILGLPEEDAAIFLIRTHLHDIETLTPADRQTIARAIESMPPQVAKYKGIPDNRTPLVEWIAGVG
jgi:hypothetical protein